MFFVGAGLELDVAVAGTAHAELGVLGSAPDVAVAELERDAVPAGLGLVVEKKQAADDCDPLIPLSRGECFLAGSDVSRPSEKKLMKMKNSISNQFQHI